MKSLKYLPILLALLASAGVPNALADSKQVRVTNNTTYTMSEFYASPTDSSDWSGSSNLLAGQTIAPGQSSNVTINDGLNECRYDLMGVLYGATEFAYQYSVNTCDDDGARWNINGL